MGATSCIILVPLKRATRVLKIPKGGNQNSLVEEEQTTQWLKEKVQMDKQRSPKHIHKTKDQVMTTSVSRRLKKS
jgi:hypothetical protein